MKESIQFNPSETLNVLHNAHRNPLQCSRILDLLQYHPEFKCYHEVQQRLLLSAMDSEFVPDKSMMWIEGGAKDNDTVFLLLSGTVSRRTQEKNDTSNIKKKRTTRRRKRTALLVNRISLTNIIEGTEVESYTSGDIFSGIPKNDHAVQDEKVSGFCITTSNCEVARVTPVQYEEQLLESMQGGDRVLSPLLYTALLAMPFKRGHAKMKTLTAFMDSYPFFKNLQPGKKNELCQGLQRTLCAKAHVIQKQGEEISGIFINFFK